MRQRWLVTGAGRGFGRAVCEAVVSAATESDSIDWLLVGRAEVRLHGLTQQLKQQRPGDVVQCVAMDFGDSDQQRLQTCVECAVHDAPAPAVSYDRVVLVQNAGSLGPLQPVHALPSAELVTRELQINVTAAVLWCRAVIRWLLAESISNGDHLEQQQQQQQRLSRLTVVQVSSLAALQPFDCWSLYCTGKAARDMFHRSVANEYPMIRVLNYAPGPLDTDMQVQVREEMPATELRDQFRDMHARGQLIAPADSARRLVRLLTSPNAFVSGQHVDYFDVDETALAKHAIHKG